MTNKQSTRKTVANNRRARHEFDIEETFEAGLMLLGSEVKSLRDGALTLGEGYIRVEAGEVFLVGAHIAEYKHANRHNHEPTRPRKLLLHEREIRKIAEAIHEKGRSCVPLEVYFIRGLAKLQIGIGRGKRAYDKRQDIKERDAKREMARARRDRGR